MIEYKIRSLLEKVAILLLLLTTILESYGQASGINNPVLESTQMLGVFDLDKLTTYDVDYSNIKGSPYLEKNTLSGYIVLIDNRTTEELPLQYDIYTDEFFIADDNGKEIIFDLKLAKSVYMKGVEEEYIFKRVNPKTPLKFYEILYQDDTFSIYNHRKITFYEGTNNGITTTEPRFSQSDNYYALKKGKNARKIKLKKKSVFKLFSKEDQRIMDKLAKEQNIKLKKSKDFKKLFDAMKN